MLLPIPSTVICDHRYNIIHKYWNVYAIYQYICHKVLMSHDMAVSEPDSYATPVYLVRKRRPRIKHR